MNISRRPLVAIVTISVGAVACGALALAAAPSQAAGIPFDQPLTGKATYYDDVGYGACGTTIDAANEPLVAVSHEYWTSTNPNTDPLCSGVQVRVSYQGKNITVPVVDKCPSCDATHLDLSKPAFAEFADLDVGVISGLSWSFVKGGGTPGETAGGTPGETAGGTPGETAGETASRSRSSRTRPGPWARHHPRGSKGTRGPAPSSSTARPTTTSKASGTTIDVLLTGYGWWDNTPAGSSEISDPVLHQNAGGTGTYADPITAAVPYHCGGADGAGCLHWPAGTRFYLPDLQRYVMVEDTCGDGGPDTCPDSTGDHLDVWVGGRALSHSASDACEERITGPTKAVLDPPADLPVTEGDICR
jgi:hypothetical protein